MRHLCKGKKFGLKKGPRRSFLRILAHNLIMKEKIMTTEAKAKALKSIVERLVTHAKKQNVSAFRLLLQKIPKSSAYKLYHEIAPRYLSRKGGYIRVIKQVKTKKHDGSKMAVIEFV